jgi:hypothetical protein
MHRLVYFVTAVNATTTDLLLDLYVLLRPPRFIISCTSTIIEGLAP